MHNAISNHWCVLGPRQAPEYSISCINKTELYVLSRSTSITPSAVLPSPLASTSSSTPAFDQPSPMPFKSLPPSNITHEHTSPTNHGTPTPEFVSPLRSTPTPPPFPDPKGETKEHHKHAGAIVGSIIAAIVVVLILVIFAIWAMRRRRRGVAPSTWFNITGVLPKPGLVPIQSRFVRRTDEPRDPPPAYEQITEVRYETQ